MTESVREGEEAHVGRDAAPGGGPQGEDAPTLTLEELVARLEELFGEIENLDDPARAVVFEFLDGIDVLHREAVTRLGAALSDQVAELREDPAIAWLFDAYGVGVDEHAVAEAALGSVRPYIHSHGGEVEVLSVEAGVVHVRMSGACSGCTASAITLKQGVEDALRERFPGFVALTVEEDHAAPHPPPGATLLQIQSRPR